MVRRVKRWQRGDVIVLREMWGDRIWSARPLIVVDDRPEYRALYAPNPLRYRIPVDDDDVELRLPKNDWRLAETTWTRHRVLSFGFDGGYAVLLSWGAADEFGGYYVNLEDPLRPTPLGFDTTDNLLDVLIDPDRSSWRWKDEDELEEAIARGLFTGVQAEGFRRAGERGLRHVLDREAPFDRDWEDWRPDPSWPEPRLPDGWDRI
jgi:hypothetical protein